jgi:hypothetical protein
MASSTRSEYRAGISSEVSSRAGHRELVEPHRHRSPCELLGATASVSRPICCLIAISQMLAAENRTSLSGDSMRSRSRRTTAALEHRGHLLRKRRVEVGRHRLDDVRFVR